MQKLLGAAFVAALLIPNLAIAAEKSGKVKNWFESTRNVVLADDTECFLGKDMKEIPAGLGVGKDVTLTFTTDKNVNTCSKVEVK